MDIRQQGTQRFCRVLRGGSERRSKRLQQCSGCCPRSYQQRPHVWAHVHRPGQIYRSSHYPTRYRELEVGADGWLGRGSLRDGGIAATLQILANECYKSQEDYTWALAEAICEEYKAIVDAGFILQIDDPALVDIWDWWYSLNGDMAGYRKWAAFQVEAVNHALRGIPEDRVRFHICWGSWHGPHSGDVPLKDVVDLLLKVNAQGYSVEMGNVRHEHEWKVWSETRLPDGKLLIPGVVSHATNLIEHPDLVADRIIRLAKVVGRENVIAGTDCGLGGRVHHQIAWAKLLALSEGAKLASKELWQ